jgi:hypothetical protein
LVRIATSIASSAATFCSTFPAVAYSITSLSPDDFSKAGASCCSTARIAPEHTTLISAALAALAERPVSSARIRANGRRAIIGILPPQLELIIRVERQRRKSPGSSKPPSMAADKMLAANRLGGLFKGAI